MNSRVETTFKIWTRVGAAKRMWNIAPPVVQRSALGGVVHESAREFAIERRMGYQASGVSTAAALRPILRLGLKNSICRSLKRS